MAKQTKADKARAWKVFSKYVRLRDALNTTGDQENIVCYTCGKTFPFKEMQAGHGISGRCNAILFDEDIVRAQCRGCNLFKGGNYEIFVPKLINEYSLEWYENKVANSHKPTKLDYKEIEEYYKHKIKELDSNN